MKKRFILLLLSGFAALLFSYPNGASAAAALHPHTTSSAVQAAPSTQAQPIRLSAVQFVNPKRGWTLESTAGDTANPKLWRTKDAGAHWTASAFPKIRNAAFFFADRRYGYAIGSQDCKDAQGQTVCGSFSILHTADSGATWQTQLSEKTASTDPSPQVQALNAKHATIRVGSRILHTHDGGQHWMDISIPEKQAAPYRIWFVNPRTGYAAGRIGSACPDKGLVPATANADCRTAIWQTQDGGSHWKLLPDAPSLSGEWYPVDLQFVNPNAGYVLFANPDTHGARLYATANAGHKWTLRNDKLPGIRPYPVKLDFVNEAVGWVPLSVGAGPVEGGLLTTKDAGTTFTKATVPGIVSAEDSDLLSPSEGWLIGRTEKTPERSALLHTGDGGLSWHDRTPAGR